MNQPISIKSIASTSPLGDNSADIWKNYKLRKHFLSDVALGQDPVWGAKISKEIREKVDLIKESSAKYRDLDDTVLLAIYTARNVLAHSGWKEGQPIGVNIGSSRGATGLFEKYHQHFIQNDRTPTLTSPTTTLGNISSWVAHDLQLDGPVISHSITCSTSLHALLNAIAWLRSGMATRFIGGGSESPLTAFTVAQMQALKIYSDHADFSAKVKDSFPSRALDLQKRQNSMVLGEAASLACIELGISDDSQAVVEGLGYATEPLVHNVSLSAEADCIQSSMRMALGNIRPEEVDVVVMHAPGTIKGDLAEFNAVEKVFGSNMPALTSNKWKIGHCLGPSGMLSVELAIMMLQHQEFIGIPFIHNPPPQKLERILVNAVGFGGNAVSILLKKV